MQGGLQLTADDDEVFRLLLMLGVMTIEQLQRLSLRVSVAKRLLRLRKAGYLEAKDVFDEERRRVLVYRLGEAALPELRLRNPLVTQRQVYRPQERTAPQLLHSLMVSECAVRVMESLRGSQVTTPAIGPLGLPFYHARVVAEPSQRRALQRFATQHEVLVDGRRSMIRPDLVFALARGDRARLFFLEADRGGEGYAEIGRKVRCYGAYARHHLQHPDQPSLWSAYGDRVDSMRVLLVTTAEQRLSRLLPKLAATPGGELVRLALMSRVRAENVVFALPWCYLGPDGGRAEAPLMRQGGVA